MSVRYTRVGWQDAPSTDTPIDAANLNHMDNGILALSEEVDTELPLLQEQINDISTDIDTQIDEKVPPEVSSWLAEHVDPVGSAVVVDDTLTIQGAAADAKKTGDEISDLKDGLTAVESDVTDLKEDYTDIDDRVTALEEGGSGSGLTEDIKQALLQIAEKVAYIDEDGQDYYDDLYDALYPPADLVSISAVYTQSGTVYDTDSLDSLKTDLVVTAHMSDQTTRTVTEYTLSGTLTEGTSIITVTYGGKTTTFTVTVASAPLVPSEYQQVEYIASSPETATSGPLIVTESTLTGVGDAVVEVGMMLSETVTANKYMVALNTDNVSNTIGIGVGTLENGTTLSVFPGTVVSIMPESGSSIVGKKYDVVATITSTGASITDGANTNSEDFSVRTHANAPINLFGLKKATVNQYQYCFPGRCYYAKVTENGVAIVNLVPCYRKADSVVGMYDTVNSKFYTAVGTGTFTAGDPL